MIRPGISSTLFRYFGGRYLAWVLASGVGLTIVVSLIHAIELARRSSNKQTVEDVSILNLVLLNIPTVIETTLPIVLIIGSMVCFEAWNRTNEFVVSRGFGKSIWSVLSPVAVVAFLIGVVYVSIINPIGSVTSRHYESMMNSIFGSAEQRLSVSADGIWLRDEHPDGRFIIHGEMLEVEMSSIVRPVIYKFDGDNNLNLRIRAEAMQLTDSGWVIEDARSWDREGLLSERGSMMLPSSLGILDLGLSSEPPNTIAVYSLPSFIALLERAGLPAIEHRIHLHKLLAMPLLLIGLAMISARATLTNLVRGRRAMLFTRGMFIAVSITLFSHFMQVLGESLRLPVILAAWAPALTVAIIGTIMLARMDEA
jgi:lipopolysaccharide export system permease protein